MTTGVHHKSGFSFIELMFAVVVMGIGMIGLAAAMSVGSATVQSTFDESTAARVARSAYAKLSHVMTADNTKSLGSGFVGFDLSTDLKDALKTQLVESSDHRFAWIPIYQRVSEDSRLAQVVVVVVRCVSGTEYTNADISPTTEDPSGNNPPTLMPRSMAVNVADVAGGADTITFDNSAQADVVAPGAIIVTCGSGGGTDGGRIFKVSELIDPANHVWSLAPGYDCNSNDDNYTGNAFVVGRGYADPNNPAAGFSGASQALAAYSMIVELH